MPVTPREAADLSVVRDAAGAILFTGGVMVAVDVMSALNSSPWTSENFGANPEKAASARGYVRQSILVSLGVSTVAAAVAGSAWPIIGSALMNGYLFCLYERALQRAQGSGSTGWGQ